LSQNEQILEQRAYTREVLDLGPIEVFLGVYFKMQINESVKIIIFHESAMTSQCDTPLHMPAPSYFIG
jgi:hypothetical protein